jgi:hypothetical protein
MAMNEDSVVSSLNELRRMANERSRREAEARSRLEAERRAWEDRNRAGRHGETRSRPVDARQDAKTHTMTYGFPEATIQVEGYGAMGQWQPPPAQTQTLALSPPPQQLVETQTSRMSPSEWAAREESPMAAAAAAAVRPRGSSFGPVLVTLVLCGIAGAAGYYKLQQDFRGRERVQDETMKKLELAKSEAVEAAARADAQVRVQATAYEQRLRTLTGKGGEAAAAAPVTMAARADAARAGAGAPAALAAKGPARKSRRWWRRGGGWGKRAGAAPAAASTAAAPGDDKKAALPKIARKKKLNDDPLDGLKL